MAKKDKADKKLSKKKLNNVSAMDAIVDKLIMSLDDNYVSTINLNEKNAEFKSIINDELDMAKGISGGSIVDFARSVFQNNNNTNTKSDQDDDVLYKFIAQNSGDIYTTYLERNKNQFNEARDLNFIAKMVPSLNQSVQILLNHITSSDDLSGIFTRSLDIGSNMDPMDADTVKSAIEQFEDDNRLLFKLKNICYKGSLEIGQYYIYAISYSKLFTEYSKTKAKTNAFGSMVAKSQSSSGATEHIGFVSEGVTYDHIDSDCRCISATCALEKAEFQEIETMLSSGDKSVPAPSDLSVRKSIQTGIADIYTLESAIPAEILEIMPGIEAVADMPTSRVGQQLRSTIDSMSSNANRGNLASDGTVSINTKAEKFDTTGTYIKFIEPSKIIPIEVLDETIGYLYVETKNKKKDENAAKFVSTEFTNVKKMDAIDKIANMLTDKIISKFSAKFVADNAKFKNLIANCILANGIVNKEYKIQFISPEDLIPFNINPDKDGRGQSVLKNAMFPAKLLTSYELKKNLNYINKSGDKTIAHVRGGQTDMSRKNQVMRIIRNLQESNITFGDMMSDYSMMFHKYASDNNIVMPMGRNGNRLIEFEKMEGQNIDMNTEYEKNLENNAITATGVSPLMIEQYNQADFAKSYTTAHIGLAGFVSSIQSDLEEPTTRLYKIIIQNLNIDDRLKQQVLPCFKFKLPRPKSLAAVNNTESMSNTMQIAETIIQLKYGDQVDDPIEKKQINAVKFAIVKELTPFIDWSHMEDLMQEAVTEVDNIKTTTGTGSGESDIAGPSEF